MQWQHQLSIGLLALLCSCQNSDRPIVLTSSTAVPLGRSHIIPAGTVGMVSLQKETPKNYELKVIFPDLFVPSSDKRTADRIWLRKNDRVSLQHSLQLFDASSSINVARILPVEIEQWCQNDGGFHYRSIVKIVVSKNELRDRIQQVYQLEKFVLFAVVGDLAAVPLLTTPIVATTGAGRNTTTSKLVMAGKQPQTKRLVARVLKQDNPLWAGCGDGAERPSLVLQTASRQSDLRCCGP